MRFLIWGMILGCSLARSGAQTKAVDFNRDVQPILTTRCSGCHGPQQQMNGLRVDMADALIKGGNSGPVVVPGDSGASKLIQRVSSTKKGFGMPPPPKPPAGGESKPAAGRVSWGVRTPPPANPAPNPKTPHWSFQPLTRPPAPDISDRDLAAQSN